MFRPPHVLVLSMLASTGLSSACGDDEAAGTAESEAAPEEGIGCRKQALDLGNDKLDLLFVIDNSGSMAQEQAKLAEQIPVLLKSLARGQTDDGLTFTPLTDLHVGVITTDMGLSGHPTPLPPSCEGFGDDGVLLKQGRGACALSAPAGYLSYTPEQGTLDQTLADLSCLASVGTNGCGFEQQLEAMYKALAPSRVKFAKGSGGHADAENAGFLRPDAALAIVHLSDEEDCSISDQGYVLFDDKTNHPAVRLPGTEMNLGLNIRCAFREPSADQSQVEAAGLIHSPERYVQEFKNNVKPGNPDSVLFIAIVGIPDGSEGLTPQEILGHPGMRFAIDPQTGGGDPTNRNTAALDVCRRCVTKLGADCANEPIVTTNESEGYVTNPEVITGAKAGLRFVKVAQGFGANGLVQSICAESFAPALNNLVHKIAKLPKPSLESGCKQ